MAYRKRSRSGYSRKGYSSGSRSYSSRGSGRSSRRSGSRSAAGPRQVVLRLEVAPASPVSRPSYLAAANPAFIPGPKGGKAKL